MPGLCKPQLELCVGLLRTDEAPQGRRRSPPPRHTPILMSSFGPVLLLRQGVMGEQEVISPATPTVTSPKKQGSWFSRSTSKLPTPRTPSTSGSHGFFHHRTPLTHSPEEENAALEALKARIRQDTEEWHFWLE